MDEAKIIEAATAGTASLATGYLATLIRDLRESYKQMAYNHEQLGERMVTVEKRLDAASKAFAELKAERHVEPASTQRPEPTDQ